MYKNCCILRKSDKRIMSELDKIGYFCEGVRDRKYLLYTHGVYTTANAGDLERFQKYCEANDIENFYTDCGTNEEEFLRLAEEEM